MRLPDSIKSAQFISFVLAKGTIYFNGLFALALGLLQTWFDHRTDARGLLLHRPVSAAGIFWGKLAAGFVCHTLIWLIPLSLTALYLEYIGPEQLPVTWRNVIPAAITSLVSFLFHPAAMWMVCRDARWIGTKCLPLSLPLVTCYTHNSVQIANGQMIVIAVIIPFSCLIILAVKHAFTHQTFLPAASSKESRSWANMISLTLSSALLLAVANEYLAVIYSIRPQPARQKTTFRTAVSTDGRLWELQETRIGYSATRTRRGRLLDSGQPAQTDFIALDGTWTECQQADLPIWMSIRQFGLFGRFRFVGYTVSTDHGGTVALFERHGRLHVYSSSSGKPGLVATVTPLGVYKPDQSPQGRFRNVWSISYDLRDRNRQRRHLSGHRLLVDAGGIYQIDFDAGSIRKLTDKSVRYVAVVLPSGDQANAQLWAWDNNTVYRFSMTSTSSEQPLPPFDSTAANTSGDYRLDGVKLIPNGQWSLAWIDNPKSAKLKVSVTDGGNVVFVAEPTIPNLLVADDPTTANAVGRSVQYPTCRFGEADGTLSSTSVMLPAAGTDEIDVLYTLCPVPPIIVAGTALYYEASNAAFDNVVIPALRAVLMLGRHKSLLRLVVFHAILAAVGSILLARYRGCSGRASAGWAMVGVFFGVTTWLTIIAVYPRRVTEKCMSCQRPRRIDLECCEHCDAEWEMLQPKGGAIAAFQDARQTC